MVVLKLDLLNMVFGLVHSTVERSTSRHGQCSAALQVGLGFSSWSHCMEMGELRTFFSFFPRTIPMWNSLPSSVVSSNTIEEFKAQI